MSASASNSDSKTSTTDTQTSVQGASGAQSPTITAGQTVSYNDPTLQLSTVTALADTIKAALASAGSVLQSTLSNQNSLSAQVAQQGAQQQSSVQDQLTQVIAAEQELAAAQGTGGASITAKSTNYFIFGAIGVALLAVLALFFRPSSKTA